MINRSLAALVTATAVLFTSYAGIAVRAESEEPSWTVFEYFCGSDLESGDPEAGCATIDIEEMISATEGTNVRFVIETGGTDCHHKYFDSEETRRYVIEDGNIVQVGKDDLLDMGDEYTLREFLKWGIDSYSADHMAVILWDHGGGSIGGCCYDEIFVDSHLTLPEIDQAFSYACSGMENKFDFVAFDCCNMATLEMAELMVPYSDYLIASQETMPGTGFEYTAFSRFLCDNPKANGRIAGLHLCLAYWDQEGSAFNSEGITVSMTDLSLMDEFNEEFEGFCAGINSLPDDWISYNAFLTEFSSKSDFGSSNYDFYTFVRSLSEYSSGADELEAAFDDMIIYKAGGGEDDNFSGLTIFVPMYDLSPEDDEIFSYICPEGSYRDFVYSLPWM